MPPGIREDEGLQVRISALPEACHHTEATDMYPIPHPRQQLPQRPHESQYYDSAPVSSPSIAARGSPQRTAKQNEDTAAMTAAATGVSPSRHTMHVSPMTLSELSSGAGRTEEVPRQRDDAEKKKRKRWLAILAVGLVVSLIANVVIAAALGTRPSSCREFGGEIGAAVDLYNYAAPDPDTIKLVATGCPGGTGKVATSPLYGARFKANCGFDYQAGCSAEGGGVIRDLAQILAYSFDECLDACAALGPASLSSSAGTKKGKGRMAQELPGELQCRAVTFRMRLADTLRSAEKGPGNCWLKNATLVEGGTCRRGKHVVSYGLVE